MKAFSVKPHEVKREWFTIDAEDKILGRVAAKVAYRLRGKYKPEYTPHVNTGDYIIVINADKLRVTGAKFEDKKYYRRSGSPGGIYERTFREMQERFPGRALEQTVKGMLPRDPLGYTMIKKLKVYAGAEHVHATQQPKALELKQGRDMNGKYYYSTGRRKSSVARVFLQKGSGQVIVNGRPADEFFSRETSRMVVRQLLVLTENAESFSIKVSVVGGGETGQSGAIRHGITRALIDFNAALKPALSQAGFVACDARGAEHKRPDLRKTRHAEQFSKR